MRPASQRFFIHSCIYVRILIISYLATFLGTNSLSMLKCRKEVNQSMHLSLDFCRQKCSSCSRFHCARCIVATPTTLPDTASPAARWAVKNFGISRRSCYKCAMLSAGDYTREDLLLRYSAREIRTFLVGQHVVIDGCKEKHDLVELAMRISRAPNRTRDSDDEHSAHVAQMKVRSRCKSALMQAVFGNCYRVTRE